jgi:glycosyltransferase involved in cell wall biosynthesis
MSRFSQLAAEHDVVRPPAPATPRVSVIVPTYNTRAHVRAAVESLLRQTLVELEVIVIDDASSDGSTETLSDITDSRLRIVRHWRNQGLSGARNTGIALSRGQYVALLDADDVSLPLRCERQVALLDARPEVGLVGCWSNRIDLQGRLIAVGRDEWRVSDAALRPLMLFTNPFTASTIMVRRSALPERGFLPIYAEDYALVADVARAAEVALVRETLVDYRITPGGIMQSKLERVAEDGLATQRSLLAEAGLDEAGYDFAQMRALLYFGRADPGAMTLEWLLGIRHWIERIHAANSRSGRYSPDALLEASARAWDVFVLHATRTQSLRPCRRYLTRVLPFLMDAAAAPLRARSLGHSVRNALRIERRASVEPTARR